MNSAPQNGPLLLGQYKPSCDADGHFNRVQCHEGYCFCVDERGIPDFSTKVRFSKPKCAGKLIIRMMYYSVSDTGMYSEKGNLSAPIRSQT